MVRSPCIDSCAVDFLCPVGGCFVEVVACCLLERMIAADVGAANAAQVLRRRQPTRCDVSRSIKNEGLRGPVLGELGCLSALCRVTTSVVSFIVPGPILCGVSCSHIMSVSPALCRADPM